MSAFVSAFVSACIASVGASLLMRGVMHGSGVLVAVGAAILAIQAAVLWLLWATS